jgi:hypothetical protein
MLARHFAVLRPHTANKMLRLAISKRPMPTAPVMSIPLIPFALRCQGSFDPGLRVFNGQRRAVDFARCSLARPSGVSRRFRADARGFPILVARESDLDANDGPLPFFSGYPSSRPGLHSIRARRGFAISRSRRNHPSVAPSRRDPCRWFRIGFWAAVGWLGEASPLCRGSAFLLTPFLAINEIYERAISTVHPSDRPLYESLLAKLP